MLLNNFLNEIVPSNLQLKQWKICVKASTAKAKVEAEALKEAARAAAEAEMRRQKNNNL